MTEWVLFILIVVLIVMVLGLQSTIERLQDENAELREQVRKLTRRNYL